MIRAPGAGTAVSTGRLRWVLEKMDAQEGTDRLGRDDASNPLGAAEIRHFWRNATRCSLPLSCLTIFKPLIVP